MIGEATDFCIQRQDGTIEQPQAGWNLQWTKGLLQSGTASLETLKKGEGCCKFTNLKDWCDKILIKTGDEICGMYLFTAFEETSEKIIYRFDTPTAKAVRTPARRLNNQPLTGQAAAEIYANTLTETGVNLTVTGEEDFVNIYNTFTYQSLEVMEAYFSDIGMEWTETHSENGHAFNINPRYETGYTLTNDDWEQTPAVGFSQTLKSTQVTVVSDQTIDNEPAFQATYPTETSEQDCGQLPTIVVIQGLESAGAAAVLAKRIYEQTRSGYYIASESAEGVQTNMSKQFPINSCDLHPGGIYGISIETDCTRIDTEAILTGVTFEASNKSGITGIKTDYDFLR